MARLAAILTAVAPLSSGCVGGDTPNQAAETRTEVVTAALENLNDFTFIRSRLLESSLQDTLGQVIDAAEAGIDAGYDFNLIKDDVQAIRQAVDETIAEGGDTINGVPVDTFAAYADAYDEWIQAEEPTTRPLVDCVKLATEGMSPDTPMEVVAGHEPYRACVLEAGATAHLVADAVGRVNELARAISRMRTGSSVNPGLGTSTTKLLATTSTPTQPTTSTIPSLDRPVETAYEAFCTGFISGLTSFEDSLLGTDYWEEFGHGTWFDCMAELSWLVDDVAAEAGFVVDEIPFDSWYIAGCRPTVLQHDIETFGPLSDDSFPSTDDRIFFAEATCAGPFQFADELGDEWEILRSGVCYYFDFEPSEAQIESGMVPCPSLPDGTDGS
jgi:hypothetical protein